MKYKIVTKGIKGKELLVEAQDIREASEKAKRACPGHMGYSIEPVK